MENLLRRYNGDLYNFDNIESHSAGARESKDGSDPTANFSASSQRKFAADDDFDSYSKAINFHDGYTEDDAVRCLRSFSPALLRRKILNCHTTSSLSQINTAKVTFIRKVILLSL